MMTSAQVVETSVNVTSNSPSQDYTHPDDHNLPNYKFLGALTVLYLHFKMMYLRFISPPTICVSFGHNFSFVAKTLNAVTCEKSSNFLKTKKTRPVANNLCEVDHSES